MAGRHLILHGAFLMPYGGLMFNLSSWKLLATRAAKNHVKSRSNATLDSRTGVRSSDPAKHFISSLCLVNFLNTP